MMEEKETLVDNETLTSIRRELEILVKKRESTSAKVWEAIFKLLVPGVIALVGWQWKQQLAIHDNDSRIKVMESNRFTNNDGAALERSILKEMADQFPPAWLKESVNEIKQDVKENGRRISALEAKIR